MVIPTSSAEKANIILKEGQKVMVLKSPKGIYMQLESGKIIAIRTALKMGQNRKSSSPPLKSITSAEDMPPTPTGSIIGANKPATPRQRNLNHVNFGRAKNIGTARPFNAKTGDQISQYPPSNSNSSFDAEISDDSQIFDRLDAQMSSNSQMLEDESNEDIISVQNKPVEIKCTETMPKTPTGRHEDILNVEENKTMKYNENDIAAHKLNQNKFIVPSQQSDQNNGLENTNKFIGKYFYGSQLVLYLFFFVYFSIIVVIIIIRI